MPKVPGSMEWNPDEGVALRLATQAPGRAGGVGVMPFSSHEQEDLGRNTMTAWVSSVQRG